MPLTLASRHPIPSLRVELQRWTHPCGLVHLHLAAEDAHRAFCIGFRTPPGDDTGLPHILEHTALCGSRRYPVRDPFFMMLRRSLQTFMNAMTYPDFTCYPFATQVPKDWDNLLGVYLDAALAPVLDARDFAQEGHRLEEKDGRWSRHGVVFNEMKGALDGTAAQLALATGRRLLPDTVYAKEGGGDPDAIPALRHADLVAFHRRCYCPANALVVTYGDGDPRAIHAALAPYLAESGAALPPPAAQPHRVCDEVVEVRVPLAEGTDPCDASACAITWSWGDLADLDAALEAELVDRLLLGHAGAPLRRALEGCGFARGAGSSGLGGSGRCALFSAELEGLEPADHKRLRPLVWDCLARVAAEGVPASETAAALDQLELARREIRGDHYPFGLELCLRTVSPWCWGADPLPFLDQGPAIARLRARAGDASWLKGQVRARLLDNPHRAEFHAIPDAGWHAARDARERAAVEADIAAAGPAGQEALRAASRALAERHAQKDDPRVLPDLALTDVPAQRRWAVGRRDGALTVFSPGTNGVLHLAAAAPLPPLAVDELPLLALLVESVGELGALGRDFAALSAHLNACCGGLRFWIEAENDPADPGCVRGLIAGEVKGLASRAGDFLPLLLGVLATTRFDETVRLRELVEQALQRLQERVPRAGNRLAALAAMRGLPGAAGLGHRLSGLGRLAWLRATAAAIADDAPGAQAACADLGARLAALRDRLLAAPWQRTLIGDAAESLLARLPAPPAGGPSPQSWRPAAGPAPATGFTTATGVNYVALVFPGPNATHADAPAVAVAARLLTHAELHPRLREKGGAYGGGAGWSAGTATIALTSYRDPRLAATVEDMRAALRWLATCPDDPRPVKEAILAMISDLDTPASPAGEARGRWLSELKGGGPAVIDRLRQGVLAVTPADLRRVAATWLPADGGSLAAVTSAKTLAASGLGWESVVA